MNTTYIVMNEYDKEIISYIHSRKIENLWIIVPTLALANKIYVNTKEVKLNLLIPNNFSGVSKAKNTKEFLKTIPGIQNPVTLTSKKVEQLRNKAERKKRWKLERKKR